MTTSIRPSLSEIVTRVQNDATSRLTKNELSRSDLNVFIRVIAGASHSIYQAIDYYKDQLFSDSAEVSFLERRAAIFNITRKSATKATGAVKFEFYNDAVDVPVGTLLKSSAGYQYKTLLSPDASGTTSVKATTAGTASNLAVNEILNLVNPIEGVKQASVSTEIKGGIDAETDEELRARVLARTQEPPRQGTKADYVAWALEVDGVGYAWCYPKEMGDGSVTVRILDVDGYFPDTDLLTKCKEYIISKASILATIYVESPLEQKCNLTLSITPDTLAIRDAAETAIKNLFKQESVPGGTIYISHINACLSSVADEQDHVIIEPTSDFIAEDSSHLLTLGDITWQD